VTAIGQLFLDHHFGFHPVDGSFAGARQYDGKLPRADRAAASDESRAIARLAALAAVAPEHSVGERLDKSVAQAELAFAALCLAERPRFANPAWYSGEACFAIVGLLLPQSAPLDTDAITLRLKLLPDFLADGRARLGDYGAAPAGWCGRARREAAALARFLTTDLPHLDGAPADWQVPAKGAARALASFAAALDGLADRNPAAGAAFLDHVLRGVHGLAFDADAALRDAEAAFARLETELAEGAARLCGDRSWQQQIADLADLTPAEGGVADAYRDWHGRAAATARRAGLVTPEDAYGLDYRFLAAPFRRLAPASYFLSYRAPPALRPGAGSVYWLTPPGEDRAAWLRGHNIAALKTTHVVHHGSIGHHTQNARARSAPGLLGRVAGTDCASGLMLLSAGSMVEGWACYAEELLREAGDFYSPAERLLLKQNERRNAASVLVDINLHLGRWSMADAQLFYRDEAGFPPARVEAEVVRNSMFPGSRLMYRAGVEAIKALRRGWSGGTPRAFHDRLIGFGHVPVAAAAAEMARVETPL